MIITMINVAALGGMAPRSKKKSGSPVAAAAPKHTVCLLVSPRTNLVRTAFRSFGIGTCPIFLLLSTESCLFHSMDHLHHVKDPFHKFVLFPYPKIIFTFHILSCHEALKTDFARLPDFIIAKQSMTVYAATEKIAE